MAEEARRVAEEVQWQRLQEQTKQWTNNAINIAGVISDAHCQGLKQQHDDPLHRPPTADDYALYLFIGLKRFLPEPPLEEYRGLAQTMEQLGAQIYAALTSTDQQQYEEYMLEHCNQ